MALLFKNIEGGTHGEHRRGIEGAAARTRAVGQGYSSTWAVSRSESHGKPRANEDTAADTVGLCTPPDFASTEGALGKNKTSGSVRARTHDEQICTQ